MKRRRRNPQAQNPQGRDCHLRSLLRQALVQKLDLDFMPSRQYRSERSKTWQSSSSSDCQKSSAALSLDRYVKAFIGDKCTKEKEDTSGIPRPKRIHLPASKDLDALSWGKSLVSPSPPHMSRIEECSTPAVLTSDEHADWIQYDYIHNEHQLSGFQIRDHGGHWEHVRVLLDLSSRQSLVSEDTVHRLGMSLSPMPPGVLPSIHTRLGSAEPRWFVSVDIRTSTEMSPVSVNLVSTKLLREGMDILIGKGLFDMLGGFTALPSMPMSPETWISTSSTIHDPIWPPEIGAQFTQEHLNHPHCSNSQPDSDIGSSWYSLCGSTIELSNIVQ